ncbi:GNAT family N-acetyltransferase [Lysobacter sp. TAF61]|uniref:GNAT family N-acetyltransferase n=1 Tax=Lysobacter sp. TAF61 TaxID=3233072 RepID=UPI003F9A7F00
MEIRPVSTDPKAMAAYEQLFRTCFPNAPHLNATYLRWLYADNPAGEVIGCDAWEGDVLAAHYVCVPVGAVVDGKPMRVMLSLNTATHPDFQGKGLFTRLAEATYELGERLGIAAAYGVANANSTPGFLRKLGFTLVRPLDARVGIGRIEGSDPLATRREASFYRDWSPASLSWRVSNPARPYRLVDAGSGVLGAQATTGHTRLWAWDELPMQAAGQQALSAGYFGARLHLGLRPRHRYPAMRWFEIPQQFRPSPLNLIFRPLRPEAGVPDADAVVLGQLDFDAF